VDPLIKFRVHQNNLIRSHLKIPILLLSVKTLFPNKFILTNSGMVFQTQRNQTWPQVIEPPSINEKYHRKGDSG
jgi:hypothetical protein